MYRPSKLQTEKESIFSGNTSNLIRHHCLNGTHQRQKAEHDGLWVWMTVKEHDHIHNTAEGREQLMWLKRLAQEEYEKEHTREEFIKRYGKSYL